MTERTYAHGYKQPPARLTLAQLNVREHWAKLHPEFRRRLLAMIDGCPHDLGIGGGWRSDVVQARTFLSRYTAHVSEPGIPWDGSAYAALGAPLGLRWWRKAAGVAPSAPPGLSYHESTTPDGWALAVDLLNYRPAITWAGENASRFGLKDFGAINGEPWHFQPVEIPNSRRNYVAAIHRLAVFPLPGSPPPPPPPGTIAGVNWKPTDAEVAAVKAPPPVPETIAGKWNTWQVITFCLAIQRKAGLPITGRLDQPTQDAVLRFMQGK